MATDKRQFTMRMQEGNYDKIRVIAAVNKRSIAMQIEYLIEQCIAYYESKHGAIPLPPSDPKIGVIHNNLQYNSTGTNILSVTAK